MNAPSAKLDPAVPCLLTVITCSWSKLSQASTVWGNAVLAFVVEQNHRSEPVTPVFRNVLIPKYQRCLKGRAPNEFLKTHSQMSTIIVQLSAFPADKSSNPRGCFMLHFVTRLSLYSAVFVFEITSCEIIFHTTSQNRYFPLCNYPWNMIMNGYTL